MLKEVLTPILPHFDGTIVGSPMRATWVLKGSKQASLSH